MYLNHDEEFWRNKQICNQRKQEKEAKLKDISKRKLGESIKKKILTTMIGALDRFQKEFGEFWEGDRKMEERWQNLRKSVLDNGNNQLRMILSELNNLYTVNWTRNKIEFRRRDNG